jgi:hypothetical protein
MVIHSPAALTVAITRSSYLSPILPGWPGNYEATPISYPNFSNL